MNRIFSSLQKVILRQMLVTCLVGVVFFSIQAFNQSYTIVLATQVQGQKTVVSPEGTYYKGTPDYQSIRTDENLNKNRLQENVDNLREKLNLNEELPKASKDFLDSTQTKVEKGLEPLTGTRHGYYQENIPEVQIRNGK